MASGEFRHVYLGEYTAGPRKGTLSVRKQFKTGAVYESRFFSEDINAVEKAGEINAAFNK